ncbi:MAG TPA: class II aldolase/adducin family protein [Candidatus Binataceae bacterium]|jgi:ribulose-5-phosphate 4-epimerase/fuculose-1-phosphate aldolase|nr:class II aldolase/adducin family protein [Candidatus Binataceae bacterium]
MPDATRAIDELVAANHILFDQGVVDGFGHVSVRHPASGDRFLLARSIAPALVRAADIMEFDLDANPLDAGGRALYLERFIHSEIYRARPDAGAVVHSHSPAVVPFSVARGVALRAVWHLGGILGEGCPVFEIREAAGPGTDLLIRNRALGAALAKSLGPGPVVLMRGHGCTVVGSTVRHAVFNAVYTELSAALQSEAMRLGAVTYLTREEAEAAAACNAAQIDRSWELWKMRAERRLQPQT